MVQALARRIDARGGRNDARAPPHTRRRVTFRRAHATAGMLLGYNRASVAHDIIDIEECPIAVPEIVAALGGLRALAGLICSHPEAVSPDRDRNRLRPRHRRRTTPAS